MIATSGGVISAASANEASSPIQHVVVIFQENVSFDHYFGTYPKAANFAGETQFTAAAGTPKSDNYLGHPDLLVDNPNGANPQRLSPLVTNQLLTCDQNHDYGPEQQAFDGGKMDNFIATVGTGAGKDPTGVACKANQVMNYYDGNAVTAMWNYAQHFTLGDHSYAPTFGPSTPGALNLVVGNTANVVKTATPGTSSLTGEVEDNVVIGDPQPLGDACSTRDQVQLSGTNVGDLLNAKGLTWGFFQGGFSATDSTGKLNCGATHNIGTALGGTGKTGTAAWGTKVDYIPHHEPFQYFPQTANLQHLPPSSPAMIGKTDQANHQYDVSDFWTAANSGNLPAVSYLKAAGYQDGHAGYSDPIDEQNFLVSTINQLEKLPTWSHTLVVIAYDDSDGFYDHSYGGITSPSAAPTDALTGTGQCGATSATDTQDRCGLGPRMPLLLISPWVKANHVDHHTTTLSSILRLVEDNFHLGHIGAGSFDQESPSLIGSSFNPAGNTPALFLDPMTGTVAS